MFVVFCYHSFIALDFNSQCAPADVCGILLSYVMLQMHKCTCTRKCTNAPTNAQLQSANSMLHDALTLLGKTLKVFGSKWQLPKRLVLNAFAVKIMVRSYIYLPSL